LPYLNEKDLYEEFHLAEPWDSPHNLRLLERMPPPYGLPRNKTHLAPLYHTVAHVFVGKGTAFEDRRGEPR
jgi:hypothetical protein